MNPSTSLSRCLPAGAIAALSVVAVLAVSAGGRKPQETAQRPAADAPVHVVRAQASAKPRQEPCRTCELGAARSRP